VHPEDAALEPFPTPSLQNVVFRTAAMVNEFSFAAQDASRPADTVVSSLEN
jgi:hypothetical protein